MLASKAAKSKWAAPYPDAVQWVSTARVSGGDRQQDCGPVCSQHSRQKV